MMCGTYSACSSGILLKLLNLGDVLTEVQLRRFWYSESKANCLLRICLFVPMSTFELKEEGRKRCLQMSFSVFCVHSCNWDDSFVNRSFWCRLRLLRSPLGIFCTEGARLMLRTEFRYDGRV